MRDDAYQAQFDEMFKAIFQAMLLASEIEIDGERAALIDTQVAIDALTQMLAAVLESSHEMKTQKDIREVSAAMELRLRKSIKHLRNEFERTGRHLFPHQTTN